MVSAAVVACLLAATYQSPLAADDHAYLLTLAKDTWKCIDQLGNTPTGLPYDNSDHAEFTSVSNIGIYLTSVIAAKRLGFITEAEENERLDRTIASVEKLKTWFGFQQSWNSVKDLQPSKTDVWISVLDSANLAAGLITVAEAKVVTSSRALKLFHAMDWGKFYDVDQHVVVGGFNTQTNDFNKKWHLDLLASDSQLALFFAVATGKAPSAIWAALNRSTENKYGVTFYHPGWEGGGLFMQFISGLWLDENGTVMALSAEGFTLSQMNKADVMASPVWGWSASNDPAGGYLGWGGLKDTVVTPHASVLAIQDFAAIVVRNLHALERLHARSTDLGFYDSVDIKSGQVSKTFLVLDQGMLFLSLANYLDHNVVRTLFQQSPIVKHGRAVIPDFSTAK
jgi:hypothetical protein